MKFHRIRENSLQRVQHFSGTPGIKRETANHSWCRIYNVLKMQPLLLLTAFLCHMPVTFDFEENHQCYVIGIYSACYNEANRT